MAKPSKATWGTTRSSVVSAARADGTFVLSAPISDGSVKQGDLIVTMTADRALRVEWQATPGATPLSDLQAWSREV